MMERILGPIPTHMIQKTRYAPRLKLFPGYVQCPIFKLQKTQLCCYCLSQGLQSLIFFFFIKSNFKKVMQYLPRDLVTKGGVFYTQVNLCVNVFLT